MWVVYQKPDLKIVGVSALCEYDLDKEVALKEIVNGLVDARPLQEYDAIQVTDYAQARAFFDAFPDRLVLREGAKGKLELVIVTPKVYSLLLRCDAPDVHPVDGIPEIRADGASFTTITVQKIDERGEPQKGKEDTDLLHLRTDHGALFSADGKEEINSVKLKKGEAAFRLVSETAKRVATVQIFNADVKLLDGSIRVEFI
jgi:hypothetical protein